MSDLEMGMYVRTKEGETRKILSFFTIDNYKDIIYLDYDTEHLQLKNKNTITKSSKNIKVKFKNDLIEERKYGKCIWCYGNKHLVGKTVTVSNVSHLSPDNDIFNIKEDTQGYSFSKEMIEVEE